MKIILKYLVLILQNVALFVNILQKYPGIGITSRASLQHILCWREDTRLSSKKATGFPAALFDLNL